MSYGIVYYGLGSYGSGQTLPASDTWDIFDFCYPTNVTMGTISSYPEFDSARSFVSPQYTYNGSNDLCLYSNDDLDSGISIEISVPPTFSLQFTVLPTALPDDFSSLTNERFFVAVHNQFGKMAGLLLSENGGLALSKDGVGTDFQHIIDSADLFDEGTQYYTFRITVNGETGKSNIYVTPTTLLPLIGHQLKVTTQAYDTPQGQQDGLLVELYGSAANPTAVCFDCLRLASREVIPNERPIADPGVDRTSTLYKYASFDGRGSYDPEGQPLRYWWTITSAPESSAMWLTGDGTTPSDASSYTNIVNGAAGAFDDVKVGDLLVIEGQSSAIKYIHDDGSYAVAVDKVFPAGSSSFLWTVLTQLAWEGSWIDSTVVIAEDYTDTEPGSPQIDDIYLVGDSPTGANWVAGDAGKIAQWNGTAWVFTNPVVGQIVYSIADYMNYRLLSSGPYNWQEDDPELWELAHWSGRAQEVGTMLPDTSGLFTAELVVNDGTSMIIPPAVPSTDGSLSSEPAEVLLNVSPTGAPLGLVPDMSFIWNYLSNFWTLVEGRGMIETVWSAAAQILAGDMLELWQHDYAKGLFDIQRLFQRRWRGYDFFYEEPDYDDSLYQADIDVTVDTSGHSTSPGLTDYAYDLGVTVPSGVQNGHMLVLNGQAYEIARTKNTTVITRDPIPSTENARVYYESLTGLFAVNDTITGGTSGSTAKITELGWNYLVLEDPSGAFINGETITGAPSGAYADVTGFIAATTQRPRYWQIRPQVTSKSADFTLEVVQQADTAIFDIEDIDENDHIRVGCYVYAARGSKLCFDDANLVTYQADSDRYVIRFFGVVRRNYIPVDDKVSDLSSLQEVIDIDNIEGAPAILVGNNDFIVETLTAIDGRNVQVVNLLESYLERKDHGFDGETPALDTFQSAGADFLTTLGPIGTDLSNYLLWVEGERYRLNEVVSGTQVSLADSALTTGESNLHWRIHESGDPPDRSWAEITYVDNKDAIEANFGVRVGFSQDDWAQRTDDLDYLAAVRGLWYSFWNGPVVNNVRTACQVLMGLPFAEKSGTIIDVRTPFNTKYNRVLVQDDGDEVVVRSYLFPVALDVDDNPDTGQPYTTGDSIAQFAPVCTGVVIEDYVSNPNWMEYLIGSDDMHEVQKFHTFGVTLDSSAFNFTNLQYMISYLLRLNDESTPKVRPHYTRPIFIVQLGLDDVVDIEDAMVVGPAWPPEIVGGGYYKYPDNASWRLDLETPIPAGWTDNPSEPDDTRWETEPTYDHTTRWPNDRAASVPPRPVSFGGLHLSDVPGHVPDSWSGSWPQDPIGGGSHSATVAEGTFQYGDSDENGHLIHVYGTNETNLLSDADMVSADDPGDPGSPWSLANYGGSSHSLTAQKIKPIPSNRVTEIVSIGPSLGIEQSVTVTADRQVYAEVLIYINSGQAHIELYDGSTQVAEWRLNSPVGAWRKISLHHRDMDNTTATLRVLTGPSGGDFYVDNAALYSDKMPWTDWGYGKMYTGRTGGYTVGGLPDEYSEFTLHSTW